MTGFVAASTVVPDTGDFGRIYDTCNAVLQSVLASYSVAGVEPPDQQYVADGAPAYDFTGEHLIVSPVQLHPGLPGITSQEPVTFITQFSLDCLIHCIRTVPGQNDQGRPPTPAEITASGQQILRDWWIVHRCVVDNTLAAAGGTGELVGAPYRQAALRQIDPYGPEGFAGGLTALVTVELV